MLHFAADKQVKQERDTTGDGLFDQITHYDEQERLAREEFDTNADGQIDQVKVYEAGAIVREEADQDYDERFELTTFYADGRLSFR